MHSSSGTARSLQCGMVGLGRMGGNMARRLLQGGHKVVVFDLRAQSVQELQSLGATGASSLEELVKQLPQPRAIWLSLPAGNATESTLRTMEGLLAPGDILIESGNSFYKDTQVNAERLGKKGILLLDQGTSGGIWGLENGYNLMIGGDRGAFDRLEPAFATLAQQNGYLYVGPSGAGHFVKMVHNGIEYGMMQAYAEGFELLRASTFPELDMGAIAKLWNNGSVIRSWLLELTERVFEQDAGLENIRGYVEDSGEGRWTVIESIECAVPAPVLTLALQLRFRSRQDDSYSAKLVAALRKEFGGHGLKRS